MQKKFIYQGLVVLFISIVFCLFGISKVMAINGGGIAIFPSNPDDSDPRTKSWFIYNLDPGETMNDSVTLRNDSGEKQILEIYPVDATLNNMGGFALEMKNDSREDVGSWVQLEESEVELEIGEAKKVGFTITIPDDASVGEHAGGIVIQKRDLSEEQKNVKGGFVIQTRLGVRIYQTVPGEVIKEANFVTANLSYDKERKKYILSTTVKNNGNVTVEPSLKVESKDIFFKKQDSSLNNSLLIPRDSEAVTRFEFNKPKIGKFEVELSLSYENARGDTRFVLYPEKFSFWSIPWTETIIVSIIVLANLIFLMVIWWLKRRDKKYYKNYKIKKGDDLEDLAEKLETSWKKIAKINGIKAPYKLEVGGIIVVIDKYNKLVKRVAKKIEDKAREEKAQIEKSVKEETEKGSRKDTQKKAISDYVHEIVTGKAFMLIVILIIIGLLSAAVYAKYVFVNENNLQPIANMEKINGDNKENANGELEGAASTSEEEIEVKEEGLETASSSQVLASSTPAEQAESKKGDISVDDKNVEIKILNGNGVKGASYKIYLNLKDEGFTNISTGNADSFNYQGALVKCGTEVDEAICAKMKEALSGKYEAKDIAIKGDASMSGIEITLGAE